MKESKWFCAVLVVILIGINTLSFVFLNGGKVTSATTYFMVLSIFAIAITYALFVSRMRTKSKRQRTFTKAQ